MPRLPGTHPTARPLRPYPWVLSGVGRGGPHAHSQDFRVLRLRHKSSPSDRPHPYPWVLSESEVRKSSVMVPVLKPPIASSARRRKSTFVPQQGAESQKSYLNVMGRAGRGGSSYAQAEIMR